MLAAVILALLFSALNPVFAVAETDSSEEKSVEAVGAASSPELNLPGVQGVNVAHKFLSTRVERLSLYIDSFFGERRSYEDATGTYIQARGSMIYGRGGNVDFDGKFRAKADLPQLQEKVKLVIESDDGRDDAESLNRITTGTNLNDELEDNDVEAALQFVVRERERWDFTVRPGVRVSSEIDTFIKFRFRRNQPLGQKWLSRGTYEAAYYSDRKWENDWTLDFERYIGDNNFFRTSSSVLWRERDPGNLLLGQVFQVTHFLDPKQLVSFEIGTTAETRPHLRDLSYFSSIRYRRNIHRGWLFFEVKPQIIWARENRYEADPALVLTFEALFGAKHLR